jgi:hypothetical protein
MHAQTADADEHGGRQALRTCGCTPMRETMNSRRARPTPCTGMVDSENACAWC